VVHPDKSNEFDKLVGRRKSLRKLAKLIFGAFSFHSSRPNHPILASVEMLRALYQGGRLPAQLPLAFLDVWSQSVM